jgi:hypothetical protein
MQLSSPSHPDPTKTAILILGAQRSGTTWLGKIFDSHPDVLYRHEPDQSHPAPPGLASDAVCSAVTSWLQERTLRSCSKRPFFRKSWQSAPAFWMRNAVAAALTVGATVPLMGRALERASLPDMVAGHHASPPRVALKSIDFCNGAGAFARALPDSRTVMILRHPCGQIASIMRGAAQHRFELREGGAEMPYHEAQAMAFAADRGVDATAFHRLPPAGKYAWSWVAFNEIALDGLEGLPNARAVLYEDLCAAPAAKAREILDFAGLGWNAQTADFIARSTSQSQSTGYYAVFRDSIAAADRWRSCMEQADQEAVRAVVRQSRLARLWPDITAETT